MSLQFDQLNNQLKTNDSTNANASMVLTPSGTGSVLLNGTGQNLFLQSQALATSPWGTYQATVTNNAAVAPNNTSTASKINFNNGATSGCNANQNLTYSNGGYSATISAYFKAGELTTDIGIQFYNKDNTYVGSRALDLSTGTLVGTDYNCTSSLVSVGNGWYRLIMTGCPLGTGGSTPQIRICYTGSATGTGSNGWYVWGCQFELGSTANTYVPTTTAAIYNAPVLSFSGVASIGLQSDGSMYVQPAGTGALQAQATTSSTVGGNARGANAVDWQTNRSAAGQVASSTYTVIGGGSANSATSYASCVSSGVGNLVQGNYNYIGGGAYNTANSSFLNTISTVVGGYLNTGNGYYNFIGSGFTNSGTSASAVTTQSGTMNGTTAVTLSGSNANIKVGQYITGTSINTDTYVAAISGTSLTLSRNASGSSTSTLSFYTPHGVVVGGGNNQATGSYSFIGGGGDAGTAANRNTASGAWSTVVGGAKNVASGVASFVGGGGTDGAGTYYANTASGTSSVISGGWNNNNSGSYGTIAGGQSNSVVNGLATVGGGTSNYASGYGSTVVGGTYGTTRAIVGNIVFPACSYPISALIYGASQAALLVLGAETTNATATVLRSETNAASATNQVILPNNSAYYFTGEVISGVTGGGNTKGWEIAGVIKRGADAASTTLVGSTVTSMYADVGAATWTIALAADTTNGGLKVTFTGQAATTIRTVAQIRTTEMTY